VVAAAVLVAGAVAAKRHFGAALRERLKAPRSDVVHACGVVVTLCCQNLLRDCRVGRGLRRCAQSVWGCVPTVMAAAEMILPCSRHSRETSC
jgi:hypothetical protein